MVAIFGFFANYLYTRVDNVTLFIIKCFVVLVTMIISVLYVIGI